MKDSMTKALRESLIPELKEIQETNRELRAEHKVVMARFEVVGERLDRIGKDQERLAARMDRSDERVRVIDQQMAENAARNREEHREGVRSCSNNGTVDTPQY